MCDSVREFIEIHKEWAEKDFKPTRDDLAYMVESSINFNPLTNHYMIFLPCVVNNGTPEQVQYWYKKILNFEITGCYC